jgi:hypothetical protein
MDEQLQKVQIIQSLSSIHSLLIQGSQIETSVAGLIFIAYDTLRHYWLGVPTAAPSKKTLDAIDKIEDFLEGCADLD